MIDVHCHLNFHSFKDDTDEVIKCALAKGVTKILNVGTKIDSSKNAVQLAEHYDELYAIIGVHPHHADKIALKKDSQNAMQEDNWIEALERLAVHKKVLAIGEIGMDYFRYQSNGIVNQQLQKEIFITQIEIAAKYNLPLQIHNRHAGEDVIRILKEKKHLLQSNPGMFHCFAGSMTVLKDALDLGFSIGFDGNITYPGLAPGEKDDLRDLCKEVPLDRLVVETDSPYLTPIPHRGTRNEPSYVIITAEYIARLRNISYENLVEQTTKNVYTIFRKLNN